MDFKRNLSYNILGRNQNVTTRSFTIWIIDATRMKKFYRYIIYQLYSWRIRERDVAPIAAVIVILTLVHLIQFLTLYSVLETYFPSIKMKSTLSDNIVRLIFVVIGAAHYFLLYNKRRWEEYIEEFKHESEAKRKRGWILVKIYLIGSLLLFLVLMPILYG